MTPQELIKKHICRFNDYPQKCECFIKGIQDFIDQEIELLEKEIDNDDGIWTGREFADKWLAHLTSLKELIKLVIDQVFILLWKTKSEKCVKKKKG